MAGDQSIVMSEQQRAELCFTLLAVTYSHSRQPADAELLQRLQRRRAAADQPPPIRRARVVENTELNLFEYTGHDGLSPPFDDDDGAAGYFGADDDDAYTNGGFGAVPALSEAIVSLPEMAVGGGGGEAREKECGVCLEGFEEGDKLRKMPCEHYFHESCVFKWLQVSRLCPYCRFAMPAEEDDDDVDYAEEHDDEEDEATMCIRFLFPE
uniref:RING-type domain-containing protein n=1 Tax=Oryza punctata TaxID=4537 RepID=A0A0E0MJH4_ORYPU